MKNFVVINKELANKLVSDVSVYYTVSKCIFGGKVNVSVSVHYGNCK